MTFAAKERRRLLGKMQFVSQVSWARERIRQLIVVIGKQKSITDLSAAVANVLLSFYPLLGGSGKPLPL